MLCIRTKILVIRGGAIGDFILTLPVLSALRRAFPQARLEVLGYPHIAQLAVAGGLACAVRPIEARALSGFFVPKGPLARDWVDYFAGFSCILSYIYDPDGIFQDNVARCSAAQFIPGPHRPTEGAGLHATQTLLKPLEVLSIFDAPSVPALLLGADPQRVVDAVAGTGGTSLPSPRRWLAAHPGSGSEKKNWPLSSWAELLPQLASRARWNLLLVGGPAENERLETLAGLWPADRLQVAQGLPLVDLAHRLSRCAFFLGHDSGITHLAAALGLPGLVLWAETDPRVWRPLGASMTLLRGKGGLAALPASEVLARLERRL